MMGVNTMDEVTGLIFAVGLMVGAVSLLVFIGVGLAPLFRKDAASPQARQQRHH